MTDTLETIDDIKAQLEKKLVNALNLLSIKDVRKQENVAVF